MSGRIAIFYSVGDGFPRLLRGVRRRYPEAHLTAIVPRGMALADADRAVVDEVLELERAVYRPWELPALLRLRRSLREGRFGQFIVRYDSLKQRVMIAAAAPDEAACWKADGRILPLPAGLTATVRDTARFRMRGAIMLLRIAWSLYLRPIR